MAEGQKILPIKCSTDISADYADIYTARYIKNLSTNIGATDAYPNITEGENKYKQKSLQSNELYVPNIVLPEGTNICIGAKGFSIVNRVYVNCWNSNGNHFIYRINGNDRTFEMVKIFSGFNFQLDPKYFIHKLGMWLELIYLTNPVTNAVELIEDYYFTDGFNYMGYIRVNDCIATNGFDPNTFIYFDGNYDPSIFFRMGIPTPKTCINVVEIPRTPEDAGLINNLLFNTWQFRISITDVFGRPSEHAIISDMYIPGINDCIGGNQSLPRCLNLIFDAGNPLWDTVNIEYRNCNDTQWYKIETIFLYNGSAIGEWWTRQRNASNPNFSYNPVGNTITYIFCANGEKNAIPTTETDRLENPLPKRCQTLNKIGNRIGTANNVDGFIPFSQDLTQLITETVISPKQASIISRTITIYTPIYTPFAQPGVRNPPIMGGFTSVINSGTGSYVWGVPNGYPASTATDVGQYFPNTFQSGFAGYLLGSLSVAISTQVYVDNLGNVIPDTQHVGQSLGFMTFQKFVFTDVKAGSYIFRIASNLSNPNTLGEQVFPANLGTFNTLFDTSTTVWGVCPFTKNGYAVDVNNRTPVSELLINVCDSDYDTFGITTGTTPANQILTILSLADNNLVNSSGYIYETKINGYNQYPMELLSMSPNGSGASPEPTYFTNGTDHNGFFWFIYIIQDGVTTRIQTNYISQCAIKNFLIPTNSLNTFYWIDEVGNIAHVPPPIDPNFLSYPCNRIEVTGYILLESNNNIGIPNVVVALTRGQWTTTDDSGFYKIIAHDQVGVNGAAVTRNDVIVFSGSVCNYQNIDGNCIPTEPVQILPCIFGTCILRTVVVNTFEVIYISQRGLLSGGTYGIGVVGWDWLGRGTYIQDLGKITIPTIVESQTIGAYQVQINISPDATFPSDIAYITFWITNELTIADYIDWIVDRYDLIDNTGNINVSAPTQIRIYYASLNQFNENNNFNTTTNWDFLEPLPKGQTLGTQQPFTSDVVQFLFNGSQQFYFGAPPEPVGFVPKLITALVKYDQTGQYFLIDYTSELAGLNPNGSNALIRLVRPRNIVNEEEPYFENCNIVNIINGKAQESQFPLSAFDTYYLDTQIPVPFPITGIAEPTTTQVATVSGNITTYTTPTPTPTTLAGVSGYSTPVAVPSVINLQTFPFPFERNSPSNFWGQGCKNIGRVNIKNPYETEIISINQGALSGVLSETGQLSYLQYFDDNFKTTFIVQNTGGIIAWFYRQGLVALLMQYSKATVGYNDNNVRVDANGQVIAPSAANQFGNPEMDLENEYGCQAKDKNSIIEKNGLIHFVDTNKGELKQWDFKNLKTMTADKCDSWFRAKCKVMQNDPLRYFVASDNPIGNKIILSDFSLSTPVYINQERTYNAAVNETVVFDMATRDLELWTGFIGEMYASLSGDILNNNLFSFKNATPYNHYNLNENNSYCNFFGVQTGKVFIPIANQPPFKKKNWLNISIYCKQTKFFSDQIITETGQLSYLYLSDFQQALYFTFAPLLRNINTLPDPNQPDVINNNPLQEGDPLYGTNIQVRLISDPANDNNYCEILGVIIEGINYEKTG